MSKELGLENLKGIAFEILLSLLINSDNIRDLTPNSCSKNLSPISLRCGVSHLQKDKYEPVINSKGDYE